MPLGKLLGPSDAVLDVLGPPKTLKNIWFLKVVASACFRYFAPLNWPLGTYLGPSWADLDPKRVPKMVPQII